MKALFQHCVPTSNADELLGIFVDSFTEESYAVHFIIPFCRLQLNFCIFIGAITNIKIIPEETRFVTRSGAASSQYRNKRLRFPRCTRSRLYILEIVINRSWCSKGEVLSNSSPIIPLKFSRFWQAVVQPIVLLYLCLGQQCHLLCWRKFQVWQVFTTSLQRHSSVVAKGARTLQRKGAE